MAGVIKNEDVAKMVARDLANYSQSVAAGPFVVTGEEWVYDAADVDAEHPGNSFSGQRHLIVSQADGFVKVCIPYDEDDGHSAGEALHALAALNSYDAMKAAIEYLLPRVHPHLASKDVLRQIWKVMKATEAIEKGEG